MIPTLGHIALVLALAVAALQVLLPLIHRDRYAHQAAAMFFALVSFSFATLVYSYAVSDFSVLNVAENSHTLKPMVYKITGVWGNHEGSMLLWVWVLASWGLCVACAAPSPARVLAVQGMIAFGFLLFILATSNPFLRVFPAPHEGLDLNPLLQDIGLAVHPPLLYAGYVGFSVAFCFAMAALSEGRVDAGFAVRLQPWVLAAWVFLTLGIVSGAVWAYYELGWGGFWFWDPVENASLLPWLAGTALLHALPALKKRGLFVNWVLFLSILAFSLSLLGTFLVRSGLLTSVHAFASDPTRGVFILALLTVAIGGALLFYAWRAPPSSPPAGLLPASREGMLLFNNILLFAFCLTVLTGTLYPVIFSALDLGGVSVGAPYYHTVLLPLLLPFAALTGLGPRLAWAAPRPLPFAAPALATAMMLAVAAAMPLPHKGLSLLGLGAGGWVVAACVYDAARKRASWRSWTYLGMIAAHAGFGLLVLGVTATVLWKEEHTQWMTTGDHIALARRDVAFLAVEESRGPNYLRKTAVFSVDGAFMAPEKRWYPVQNKITSETALRADGLGILYLVLGDADPGNPSRFVVRAYAHPFALLMPAGAAAMAAGGVLAFLGRWRRRA